METHQMLPQAAESLRREGLPAPSSAAGSPYPAASGRRGARPCAPTDPLFLASHLTAGCGEPAAGEHARSLLRCRVSAPCSLQA